MEFKISFSHVHSFMHNIKKFIKLRILVILILLSYQIVEITIKYTKYEVAFEINVDLYSQQIPALTFCLNNELQLKSFTNRIAIQKRAHESVADYLKRAISCYEMRSLFKAVCNESTVMESITSFSPQCFTFAVNSSAIYIKNYFKLIVFNLLQMRLKLIVHTAKSFPHLYRESFDIGIGYYHFIHFTRLIQTSLKYPYKTNCRDYENKKDGNIYASRDECIVRHMSLQEYAECKCYQKWFYNFTDKVLVNRKKICKNKRCDIDYNLERFSTVCPESCFSENYYFIYFKVPTNLPNWVIYIE